MNRANSNRDAASGQKLRIRERKARRTLQADTTLWSTEGMQIGGNTAPRGGSQTVIVGYLPVREHVPTVCHPIWRTYEARRADLFWMERDDWEDGVLEGDVDWHPPGADWNAMAADLPPIPLSRYRLEVEEALREAAKAPFPNYLI